METPNYIKGLLRPTGGKRAVARRVWSIDLENVWVPFFTATNTKGETNIASDALGAPLRLGLDTDGSVKFSKSGRPVMKVVKPLQDQITTVRDNFISTLIDHTGKAMRERPDEYREQVEAAQKAAEAILEQQAKKLANAIAQRTEKEAEPVKEAVAA